MTAAQMTQTYGSIEAYRRRLKLVILEKPDDPLFKDFFTLYETVFTLEDERESREGFETILRLNADAEAQRDFGPFKEKIYLLLDPDTQTVVGAANTVFYAYPPHGDTENRFGSSGQINFIMVHPTLRGMGLASVLLQHVEEGLQTFARLHHCVGDSFLTCEQNNPQRMLPAQILRDGQSALIDPLERRAWWQRRGYFQLDFAYSQPALSATQTPCDYLDYCAKIISPAPEKALPASILQEHLRRFFFVSVGKLALDMRHNSTWLSIQHDLSHRAQIATV